MTLHPGGRLGSSQQPAVDVLSLCILRYVLRCTRLDSPQCPSPQCHSPQSTMQTRWRTSLPHCHALLHHRSLDQKRICSWRAGWCLAWLTPPSLCECGQWLEKRCINAVHLPFRAADAVVAASRCPPRALLWGPPPSFQMYVVGLCLS